MPANTQLGPSRGTLAINPAVPSLLIESLFPAGVAAAELRVPGDPALLPADEAACVARAVPKRIREFAAGRLCARYALARFGVTDFALRAAPDRRPVWPESLVGSITHTEGFCASVVGERANFIALGIDTETAHAVQADLWPRICVPAELAWIDTLPAVDRPRAAALIFSAKEAFYKCQYPATGEPLSFSDVRVTELSGTGAIGETGAIGGTRAVGESGAVGETAGLGFFEVAPTRPLALFSGSGSGAATAPEPLRGSYRFHESFVSCGVFLPA